MPATPSTPDISLPPLPPRPVPLSRPSAPRPQHESLAGVHVPAAGWEMRSKALWLLGAGDRTPSAFSRPPSCDGDSEGGVHASPERGLVTSSPDVTVPQLSPHTPACAWSLHAAHRQKFLPKQHVWPQGPHCFILSPRHPRLGPTWGSFVNECAYILPA